MQKIIKMNPVNFPEQNCIYAKDQPEYLPLPTHKTDDGIVTACYKLTFLEKIKIFCGAKIWVSIMTFNKPLQPQRLYVSKRIDV